MTRITENFTLEELTHTVFKFKNEPNAVQIEALKYLCVEVLQPLRDMLQEPVFVSSAFRSCELNRYVGGKTNSQHLRGEAADISSPDNVALFVACTKLLEYDQIIVYTRDRISIDFIHISVTCRRQNRGQILYCNRIKNKYYIDFKKAFPNRQPFL